MMMIIIIIVIMLMMGSCCHVVDESMIDLFPSAIVAFPLHTQTFLPNGCGEALRGGWFQRGYAMADANKNWLVT